MTAAANSSGGLLPVVQADRERAAENGVYPHADLIRRGEFDSHPRVQAFAAHRLAATPTALPGAEDALREAAARVKASLDDADRYESLSTMVSIADLKIVLAALQSPRASDEVPGEAGGADQARTIEILRRALAWHGDPQRMATTREEWQQEIDAAIAWVKANPEEGRLSFPTWAALSANPVPVDASGAVVVALQARLNARAGQYEKSVVGLKLNQAMFAHKMAEELRNEAKALSHTAPVADAQAKEGGK